MADKLCQSTARNEGQTGEMVGTVRVRMNGRKMEMRDTIKEAQFRPLEVTKNQLLKKIRVCR